MTVTRLAASQSDREMTETQEANKRKYQIVTAERPDLGWWAISAQERERAAGKSK